MQWAVAQTTGSDAWSGFVFGRPCIDVDGSKVYGSTREDGFLDAFHRYVCPLPGGHFLIIDAFSTKKNRTALYLWGGSYGGVPFNEADEWPVNSSSQRQFLDIENYFHLDVETIIDEDTGEETQFVASDYAGDRCNHVMANTTTSAHRQRLIEEASDEPLKGGDIVQLTPQCGIGKVDSMWVGLVRAVVSRPCLLTTHAHKGKEP